MDFHFVTYAILPGKVSIDVVYDFGDVVLKQTLKATKLKSGNISIKTTVVN